MHGGYSGKTGPAFSEKHVAVVMLVSLDDFNPVVMLGKVSAGQENERRRTMCIRRLATSCPEAAGRRQSRTELHSSDHVQAAKTQSAAC